MNQEYYIGLISKYLASESSTAENEELLAWLRENEANRGIFNQYRSAWLLLQRERLEAELNPDTEWDLLQQKINSGESQAPVVQMPAGRKLLRRTMAVAAIVIVLIAAGFVLYRLAFPPVTQKKLSASANVIESTLPDGTAVTLNKGSVIDYPSAFRGDTRQISLAGEAFFDVAHDASKPFVIRAGEVTIEVLGTSFFVNTNAPGGATQVILVSGKLAVYHNNKPSDRLILEPGQLATLFPETGISEKSENNRPNFDSWKTRRLVFDNVPLSEVVNTLNNMYPERVRLASPGIGNCLLTATFDHQSISSVLNVIGETLDLKITLKGSEYEISGNVCAETR